jgi:hypothetical protein
MRRDHLSPPAEREHVEAVVAGAERVLLVARAMDDAVRRPDLVDLVVLPREPGAAEDVEDLLVLDVRRRRPAAGIDFDAVDGDADRAGGGAEVTA